MCSILIGLVTHRYVRSVLAAVLLSGLIAAALLVLISQLELGYFDGWLIVAGPIVAVLAAVISAVVGNFMDRRGLSARTRGSAHGP